MPKEGSASRDNTPRIAGTAPPGTKVWLSDKGELLSQLVADSQGQWIFIVSEPLSEGEHRLVAIASDERGVISEPSEAVTFTVLPLLEPPVITSLEDGAEIIDPRPQVAGTGVPGTKVRLYDSGLALGAVLVDEKGQWAFTPPAPFSPGEHVLTVTAGDEQGWVSEPRKVTVIVLGPLEPPSITLPQPGTVTDEQQPTIAGTSEPGVEITIYDGLEILGIAQADEGGRWTFIPEEALAEGEHVLTAMAGDDKGRISETSSPLVLTIKPLTMPVSGGTDGD